MLEPLMAAAGLDRWFDGYPSVGPVQAFTRSGLPPEVIVGSLTELADALSDPA